jgi:hypothetical protein
VGRRRRGAQAGRRARHAWLVVVLADVDLDSRTVTTHEIAASGTADVDLPDDVRRYAHSVAALGL